MRYMLLLYDNENSPPPDGAEMAAWFEVTEAMQKAGVYVGGEALHPTTSSTTVRVRGGDTVATDGPFAETKEQLGGYYVLDVPDLDAAVDWAAKLPNAPRGSIEDRPVMVFDQG
jgi:hypothetical protein